jgi:isoquinoline 1-oxidoreductase beta subunit
MITGAAAAGGLLIGIATGPGRRWKRAVEATTAGSPDTLVNLWLKISPDNQLTVLVDKIEMGQGTHTGLAMLLAEELGADWNTVQVEHVPVRPEFATGQIIITFLTGGLGVSIPGFLEGTVRSTLDAGARLMNLMITGGSSATMVGWSLQREAGAAARQLLIAAGAAHLEADIADCDTRDSKVVHLPSGRSVTFGEVAADAATLETPDNVKLKDVADFKLVGQPLPRLDIPAKTDGSAVFGPDQRPPGMKFAAMVVPPLPELPLGDYDAADVREMDGVLAVVPIDNAVAVVADTWWTAQQATRKIRANFEAGALAGWSSTGYLEGLSTGLDDDDLDVDDSDGDVHTVLGGGGRVVEAEYTVPHLAHAPMEPLNCTAWVRNGECDVWTGTQVPLVTRKEAADTADVDADNVTVHVTLAGGSFGRRFNNDAVIRAVQIAKTVDYPVQLLYSREDDMASGYYRPAAVAKASGTFDETGQLTAWRYRHSGSVREVDTRPYTVPNFSHEILTVDEPIPTGPWRSVDHSQHGFFLESFADELAAAADLDPFEFRRRHLPADSRRRQVLDELESLAQWQGRGGNGRGRGLALYESFGTVVGLVLDVTVENDRLSMDRAVCVADCGIAVNPSSVAAQIEGAIVYGLTAAAYGEITSSDGAIEQQNFHNYQALRLANTPDIEVHLRNSGEFPFGAGEPGTPPSAPALANAVFAATGQRVRQLPLRQFNI